MLKFRLFREKKYPPIFILGSGRSGTTLLMKILNSKDSVMIYGEHGGFLEQIASAYFSALTDKTIKSHINESKRPEEILLAKYRPFIGYAWLNWFGSENIKGSFKNFIESLFNPKKFHNTLHWGFKEIRYACNDKVLDMLVDIYPEAKFILLTRNPFDVIASQLTMGKWGTFEEILPLWKLQNDNMIQFQKDYPNNFFHITFEEMINKESGKLADLFGWLGLEINQKQFDVIDDKQGIWKKTREDGKPHRVMLTAGQIEKMIKFLNLDSQSIPGDLLQ